MARSAGTGKEEERKGKEGKKEGGMSGKRKMGAYKKRGGRGGKGIRRGVKKTMGRDSKNLNGKFSISARRMIKARYGVA